MTPTSPTQRPAPEASVRRECRHPRAAHQHGTLAAWRADNCRCAACALAHEAARRHHAQAVITGFWKPFTAAEPIRRHLEQLRSAGVGVDQIVRLSGVPSSTVRALLYGRTGTPVMRLTTTTAARLANLRATDTTRARKSTVDATETRAQLNQLLAAGLSSSTIAGELGRTPANLRRTMHRATVTVATARAVARLHRRLLAGRRANRHTTPARRRDNASLSGLSAALAG